MVRFICFLCLLVVLRSQAQDSSSTQIVTLKENKEQKQYKKILIAGFGQPNVRHFLEELTPRMIEHYQKQGISCSYQFIGNDRALLKSGLNTVIKEHQPDAYLLLYHFDNEPDTLKTKHTSRVPRMLLAGGEKYQRSRKVKKLNNRIDEDIKMAVLEPQNNVPIWQGELYLIDEPLREGLYKKIYLLLTQELFSNKIPNGTN